MTTEAMRAQFEAWYPGSGVEGCTIEKLAAWYGYAGGVKAALQSPAVAGLVEAARKIDAILFHPDLSVTVFDADQLRATLAPFTTGAGHE